MTTAWELRGDWDEREAREFIAGLEDALAGRPVTMRLTDEDAQEFRRLFLHENNPKAANEYVERRIRERLRLPNYWPLARPDMVQRTVTEAERHMSDV